MTAFFSIGGLEVSLGNCFQLKAMIQNKPK